MANSNRIIEIDALRGFALWGILLVNIFVFHAPICYYSDVYGAYQGIQEWVVGFIVELAAGKFMFIFAFLFGYGIGMQQTSRLTGFTPYFIKRMLLLFVFGALHILFFWLGDILASYAILGLILLPFLRLPNATLAFIALFFIFFRSLYYFGNLVYGWPSIPIEQPASLETFVEVFGQGDYIEIFHLRMKEFKAFIPETLVWYMPKSLGLFALGVLASRKQLFQQIKKSPRRFTNLGLLFLLLGAIWIFVKPGLFASIDLEATPVWRPIFIGFNVLFETALGMSYVLLFTLIFQSFKGLTKVLAKTGRMALTNYFLQSLICVLLFYGYGFGLYGKLKPSDLILLASAIFILNVIFSWFYLKRFDMGPLEKFWRRLSGR